MHKENFKKTQVEIQKILHETKKFIKDLTESKNNSKHLKEQTIKYQQILKILDSNLEKLVPKNSEKSIITFNAQVHTLTEIALLIENILNNLDFEESKLQKEVDNLNISIQKAKQDIYKTSNISEKMHQFLEDRLTEIKKEIDIIIDEELNKINTQLFIFFNIQQNEIDKKDAIENILDKGEFKFNTEHEAKNTLHEIASKMDSSIKEVYEVVTKKINDKFKNIMPEINKYFTQELSTFLNKELIESTYIKTLQLKLTSLSSHHTITLDDTIITTQSKFFVHLSFIKITHTHQVEDDKVYLVKKTDIEQKLGLEFKKISEDIKKSLLDSYNQSIQETISFSKDNISHKVKEYKKAKENSLKIYDIDKNITNDKILVLEQQLKKINKLNQRIIDTKNILETIDV